MINIFLFLGIIYFVIGIYNDIFFKTKYNNDNSLFALSLLPLLLRKDNQENGNK